MMNDCRDVYEVQRRVFREDQLDPVSSKTLYTLFDFVRNSKWWRGNLNSKYPGQLSIWGEEDGCQSFYGKEKNGEWWIVLGYRSVMPHVLLHEMAHALEDHLDCKEESHGPIFCKMYLEIVEEFFGEEWAEKLENEFDNLGIQYE